MILDEEVKSLDMVMDYRIGLEIMEMVRNYTGNSYGSNHSNFSDNYCNYRRDGNGVNFRRTKGGNRGSFGNDQRGEVQARNFHLSSSLRQLTLLENAENIVNVAR